MPKKEATNSTAKVQEVAPTTETVLDPNAGKVVIAPAATGETVALAPDKPTPKVNPPARSAKKHHRLEVTENLDDLPPAMAFQNLVLLLLSVTVGVFAAVIAFPHWLPGLSTSLLGSDPKAYWYLSRTTGFVAFFLLWLSMILGLSLTNKLARLWPGGPVAFDLHQHTSLLGLAFALFHALILLGDSYSKYTLGQLLIPFAGANYRPQWIGLGQVSFYMLLLVALSFYVRKQIGRFAWQVIHVLSFSVFLLALLHGLTSGTDSSTLWAKGIYFTSGGSILFFTVYRVLVAFAPEEGKGAPGAAPSATK